MSIDSLSANAKVELAKILLAQELERQDNQKKHHPQPESTKPTSLHEKPTMDIKSKAEINSLMPLFPESILPPKAVKVAEVFQGTRTVFKEVPLSEFLTMTHRTGWTETFLVDKAKGEKPFSEESYSIVRDLLSWDHEAFGFINMKEYGWAAVCLKRIPKGTKILFSGIVREERLEAKVSTTNSHCQTLRETSHSIVFIDPKDIGNVSSFFQHAPSEAALPGYQFATGAVKKRVKTANFAARRIIVEEEQEVLCLESLRDIEPFELPTFDYSISMWRKLRQTPELFDEKLEAIPHKDYSYKDVYVKVFHPVFEGSWWTIGFSKEIIDKKIKETLEQKQPLIFPCNPYDCIISPERVEAALKAHPTNPLVMVFDKVELRPAKGFISNINQFFNLQLRDKIEKTEGIWSLTNDMPPHFELNLAQSESQWQLSMLMLKNMGIEAYLKPVLGPKETVYHLCLKNLNDYIIKQEKLKQDRQIKTLTNPINDIFGEQFKEKIGKTKKYPWTFSKSIPPCLELSGLSMPTLASFEWFKVKLEKQGLGRFVQYKEITKADRTVYCLYLSDLSALEAELNKLKVRGEARPHPAVGGR
jgi:hypothetical protein